MTREEDHDIGDNNHELIQILLQRESSARKITSSAYIMGMYQIGKLLGTGSYAKVRKAVHKLTGQVVAIKIYDRSKLKALKRIKSIQDEIQVMKQINHPNIMRFYESMQSQTSIMLVTEYCPGTSLQLHTSDKRSLTEEQARGIFKQLVGAITYLHGKQIVHRDIKPDNVILVGKTKVKLIDFGFSVINSNQSHLSQFCGTPSFMAPEIVSRPSYAGKPLDVWSLGILLFSMVAGHMPFFGTSSKILYRKISAGEYKTPTYFSKELASLVHALLAIDPDQRLRADEASRDVWLTPEASTIAEEKNSSSLFVAPESVDGLILKSMQLCSVDSFRLHDELSREEHNGLTTWYRLLHFRMQKESRKKQVTKTSETLQSSSKSEFQKFLQQRIDNVRRATAT